MIVAFCDLDDTLFQTARKCAPGLGFRLASSLRDGRPSAYLSPSQQALFNLLSTAYLIPVTARNRESFARVHLPFAHGAILNYGATILDSDGEEDRHWRHWVYAAARETASLLTDAAASLCALAPLMRVRLIFERPEAPLYVVVKSPRGDEAGLARLATAFRRQNPRARLYLNANNLALLPPWLDKVHAVRYLRQRLRPSLTLGIGDSTSDLPFMRACDYQMTPRGGQIERSWP